jgi:SHS family lactate transporter-like MFS transporter
MASSGAAQIEADAGETLTVVHKGKVIPDYATITGILIGGVIAWLFVFIILGPEADGSHFETAKIAIEENAGLEQRHELMHAQHHDTQAAEYTGKEESNQVESTAKPVLNA